MTDNGQDQAENEDHEDDDDLGAGRSDEHEGDAVGEARDSAAEKDQQADGLADGV